MLSPFFSLPKANTVITLECSIWSMVGMTKAKKPKKIEKEFINREISWLEFNERVLQQAAEKSNPLISRMRFLGIFSNNLDEFFKVRVATLKRAKTLKSKAIDPMDFEPEETLTQIHRTVIELQEKFDRHFELIINELAKGGIHFLRENELNGDQKKFAEQYFETQIRPSLVPVMLSNKTPFPQLNDTTTYMAIEVGYKEKKSHTAFALLEIPSNLKRFVEIPSSGNKKYVMFVDDIIRYRLRKIFALFNYDYAKAFAVKVTRDAELDIDDDLSKSLVDKMSRSLNQRKRGEYVRINFDKNIPAGLLDFILKKTKIKDPENIIPGGRYHNNKDLLSFPDFGKKELVFPPFTPLQHPEIEGKSSIIEVIRQKDILLHFPYHPFLHIIDLLREAAIDPHVRTIRISIYRLAKNSQILNALINAAKNGKRVIAVVEVQARFDEQNNIEATRAMQEAGIKVIPGVPGLKVHSKLILISRKEGSKSNRYVHVGSGNFNEKTSEIYTDISLLTANKEIGQEVRKIFEFFESNFTRHIFRHLLVSPFNTRRKFVDLIHEEIDAAEKKKPAFITLKMNNLVDAGMIRKLYEASQAGVKVNLIIRGVCSLIPGIKGQSENIKVHTPIGRFLEHNRIAVFCNQGDPLYFISSADWMTRNLDHRVEVTTPIYQEDLKQELQDYLDITLKHIHSKDSKKTHPQMLAYEYFRSRKTTK